MQSHGLIGRYFLLGAISFWLPDVVMNALKIDAIILFTVIPVLGLLTGYLIGRIFWRSIHGPSMPLYMLLGVWLTASTAMMVGATFSGGGFALELPGTIGVIILGLLPPYTMIMATYDGSLLVLFIVSLLMPIAHYLFEMDHWIISPRLLNRWR